MSGEANERKRPRTSMIDAGGEGFSWSLSTILKLTPKKQEFLESLQKGPCKLSDGKLIVTCPMSFEPPSTAKCMNELKLAEVFEIECVTCDLVPLVQSSDLDLRSVTPSAEASKPTTWALWKPVSNSSAV